MPKASLIDITRVDFDEVFLLDGASKRGKVYRRLLRISAVISLNLFKLERSLRRSIVYSFGH